MKKVKSKTHKATRKRFKITAKGIVTRMKQRMRNNSHRKNKRSSKRRIDKDKLPLANVEQKKVKELLRQ